MKASQAIAELEMLIKKHGDLEIEIMEGGQQPEPVSIKKIKYGRISTVFENRIVSEFFIIE